MSDHSEQSVPPTWPAPRQEDRIWTPSGICIDAWCDLVTLPSTHEVPSMTAHGSVVHHRSERGVWCRESRVFLGSDYDLSLHRCSAAADHQSADWSCTIKLVDLEVQP